MILVDMPREPPQSSWRHSRSSPFLDAVPNVADRPEHFNSVNTLAGQARAVDSVLEEINNMSNGIYADASGAAPAETFTP